MGIKHTLSSQGLTDDYELIEFGKRVGIGCIAGAVGGGFGAAASGIAAAASTSTGLSVGGQVSMFLSRKVSQALQNNRWVLLQSTAQLQLQLSLPRKACCLADTNI